MNIPFTEPQIAFMQRIGVSIAASSSFSDSQLTDLEDAITLHLQTHGFDKDYKPTPDGLLCEAIIDLLSEN